MNSMLQADSACALVMETDGNYTNIGVPHLVLQLVVCLGDLKFSPVTRYLDGAETKGDINCAP
jgi:hypothetical protein